jgi:hypothetical protein
MLAPWAKNRGLLGPFERIPRIFKKWQICLQNCMQICHRHKNVCAKLEVLDKLEELDALKEDYGPWDYRLWTKL